MDTDLFREGDRVITTTSTALHYIRKIDGRTATLATLSPRDDDIEARLSDLTLVKSDGTTDDKVILARTIELIANDIASHASYVAEDADDGSEQRTTVIHIKHDSARLAKLAIKLEDLTDSDAE